MGILGLLLTVTYGVYDADDCAALTVVVLGNGIVLIAAFHDSILSSGTVKKMVVKQLFGKWLGLPIGHSYASMVTELLPRGVAAR